jgi:hypothetical protein
LIKRFFTNGEWAQGDYVFIGTTALKNQTVINIALNLLQDVSIRHFWVSFFHEALLVTQPGHRLYSDIFLKVSEIVYELLPLRLTELSRYVFHVLDCSQ